MAGSRIKGITVEIGGDTTGLDLATTSDMCRVVWKPHSRSPACGAPTKAESVRLKIIPPCAEVKEQEVYDYLPYSRGEYNDGEISEAAQQSKDFRKRNRDAKERLVGAGSKEMKNKIAEDEHMEEKRTENVVNIDTWRANTGFTGTGNKVLKLHLELQMELDDEEEATLRKYGKSEKGMI